MKKLELVKWSENIKTGLEWQDFQHKALLDNMYQLYEDITGQKRIEHLTEALNFLDQYVVDHFGMEEVYMNKLDYPQKEDHVRQHQHFIEMIEDLKGISSSKGFLKCASLINELNIWFIEHISEVDAELANFIKENNHK